MNNLIGLDGKTLQTEAVMADLKKRFASYPGSGDNGGMDAWQTSVENRLGKIEGSLSGLEKSFARIEGKIDGLPSKAFVIGTVISLIGFGLACIGFGANVLK